MPKNKPDYTSYSMPQLLDVLKQIDRDKFPDRYTKLVAEIEERERSGENDIEREEQLVNRNQNVMAFGVVLLVLGLVEFCYFCLEPTFFTIKSRHWTAVPCVILYQQESPSSGSDLRYLYSFNGAMYMGQRLSSMVEPKHWKGGPWLQEFPNGKKMFCFLNPETPQESVLNWGWSGWLMSYFLHSVWSIVYGIRCLRHGRLP